MDFASLQARLNQLNQSQVLRFWNDLSPVGREKLAAQLASLDLDLIARLAQSHVKQKPVVDLPKTINPINAYPRTPQTPEQKTLYANAEARGHELLHAGKVAAFVVAGGQGTRLGYEGPKGEFPVTPIRNKPLFQTFAEQIRAASRDYDRPVPWYIMTSDVNDAPTRAFFRKHNFFGLDEKNVFFFQQGMMPAFALDGKLLLADKDSLALSPDGHGGSLRALERSGALADMRKRGIEHLSYFQVDNPLIQIIDPLFLGLHDLTASEMSSKTIPKAHALEKVGNFVLADGVLQVIEYSDLPDELAKQTLPDGSLRFNAGSIAIHALRVSFVQRLNTGGQLNLPWHRADKKVPHIDENGSLVKPAAPNAVKLEQFVFDAIPLAQNAIVYTTDRAEEFSPVKNAEGADSPATCRRDQVRRAARWLEAAGVQVARRPDGEVEPVLEISPLFATSAAQLKTRPLPKTPLTSGSHYFE